jgi:SNF2 family DNA or RNA helicase
MFVNWMTRNLAVGDPGTVRALVSDGRAGFARVLAGGTHVAATNAESCAMAATPLEPYAHRTTALHGAMLPQALPRFLSADEPGTGKTVMAGLYLREIQRLAPIKRAIIVCQANLATKWLGDFQRLQRDGLYQLTSASVRDDAALQRPVGGLARAGSGEPCGAGRHPVGEGSYARR